MSNQAGTALVTLSHNGTGRWFSRNERFPWGLIEDRASAYRHKYRV